MPRSSGPWAVLLLAFVVISTSALKAELPDPQTRQIERLRSPRYLAKPSELQFSCGGAFFSDEQNLVKQLEKGDPDQRLAAARELWEGHSRRYASDVLKYLAGSPPGGDGFRKFQREVEAGLKPQAILSELKEGDYIWGAWLAFLRPHAELVPVLLDALKDKPVKDQKATAKNKSEFLPETMLALGNSGDVRALEPLLELLKSKDYRIAGDAARALGYMGVADTEPKLIEALATDNGWRQVNACGALAKFGSRKALPALEKLAKDDRYTGALSVQGMAEYAIKRINEREKR